jgi:predicted metal-dependent hydrolase
MTEKREARRVLIGTYEALLDGSVVSYMLKRGPRCRHARLEVARESGLTAVIPQRYDMKRLPAFLESNKRWILYALREYCSPTARIAEKRSRSNTVPYLGEYLEVVCRDNGDGIPTIRIEGNILVVSAVPSGDGLLITALEKWYRKEAANLIREKADKISTHMGLSYHRTVIKGMRSRWGSCSVKGNLNFNWKLILLPETVIDYVIIHELTHLKEMNHGRKFWELVAKECPEWRERRKWLTKNGREFTAALYNGQVW